MLFCGAIYYDRKDYVRAEDFYRRVTDTVEQSSYDYFDALSHLGIRHVEMPATPERLWRAIHTSPRLRGEV